MRSQICVLSKRIFCYHFRTFAHHPSNRRKPLSTSSFNSDTSYFDPAAIEARLNALAGPSADSAEEFEHEPDLREQLLADESLCFLESCSTESTDEGQIQTRIQLHRVAVLPHQSRLVLHCSFVPDFPATPDIQVEVFDRQARLRVTDIETFGARLEITLATPVARASALCLEVVTSSGNQI